MSDRLRVLLVEDSPTDRQLIQQMLAEVGGASFNLECADRLSTGLERLAAASIDVILLDLLLPDSRGFETFAQVQAQAPRVPIVILSGLEDEALAVEAVREGAQDYLVKGHVDSNLLVRAIRYAVQRKQAEEALRESEQRFRDLYENAPNAYLSVGADGLIRRCNKCAEELLSYARKELVGRPVFDLYTDTPQGKEKALRVFERYRTGDTITDEELQMQKADGTPVWISLTVNAVRDARGQVVGSRSMVVDTTERKQAQEALAELNATLEERVQKRTFELQVLYELTQQIGYTINYDEMFRVILQHLHRVMRYDVAGSLLVTDGRWEMFLRKMRPTEEGVLERVKAQLLEAYAKVAGATCSESPVAMRSHEAYGNDSAIPSLHSVSSHFQVPIFAGGKAIGLLYVGSEREREFGEDDVRILYTLAGQAADSVQRLQLLLAEEQRRLGRLVESLPEGIVLLDPESRILLTNPAAVKILSLLAEGMGDTLTRLGPHSLEVLRDTTQAVPLTVTVEEPARRVFEVSVHSIPSEQPEHQGAIMVLRDVTELRKIEERARQQDRMAAVGQLAAGIAHDFNNMLTTILLYTQMLLAQRHLPSDVVKGLETILDETRRATNLVGQVLDFSRSSPVETHPVDLRSFVEEAVNILQRTLPENIRLLAKVGLEECATPFTVNADPTRIQQVLMNLVINARDAMPEGGELRIALDRVEVSPDEEPPAAEMPTGKYVCLAVSDTGTGIPPGVLPHIFEPFFTTKPRGKGTGLGLAQVYGIVKQHEGYIGVETEMGADCGESGGTTFRVYLPAHEAQDVEEVLDETSALPEGKGEMILLVEDEEGLREAGREILESLGYRVLTARDGREALEVYEAVEGTRPEPRPERGRKSVVEGQGRRIDLVIADLVLPEIGGKELIQELRKATPDLKALAMTGYAPAEDLQELKEQGSLEVVYKPFDVNALAQAVRRVLNMVDSTGG